MSIENVKKLELAMEKSCNCDKFLPIDQLTEDNVQRLIDEGMRLEKEAFATKDMDVLHRAFDYFMEEKDDDALMNGGCETLESEIFQNFSMEQIIEALHKKFSALVANNEMRAEHFAGACISHGYLKEFREIFNSTHTPSYNDFLSELEDWIGEDYPKEISILREDMKKW
jgi:NDP-sugar pyrophosphorylase family protein